MPPVVLRYFGPSVQREDRRTTTKAVSANAVDLVIDCYRRHDVRPGASGLPHLNAAHSGELVRIEIVRAPIVGEPERAIELCRCQSGVIADVQPRDIARASHRAVPAIAVVDHLLR